MAVDLRRSEGDVAGVKVSRWVVVAGTVGMVGVVAVIAITAVLVPSGSPAVAPISQHEERVAVLQHRQPVQAFAGPFHPSADVLSGRSYDLFSLAAERAKEAKHNHQNAEVRQATRGFQKEDVRLERVREHDTGVGLQVKSVPDFRERHAPSHPGFTQETVMLESNVEHDTPSNTMPEDKAAIPNNVIHEEKIIKVNNAMNDDKPEEEMGTLAEKAKMKKSPEPKKEMKFERIKEVAAVRDTIVENKVSQKESQRLPTRTLDNGRRVCETPECAMAAAQIAESLDLSADPCQDFYQFACGGWMNKHPIPESGATGTFYEAMELMDKRLHLLLETQADPGAPLPLHMLRTFYNTCKDTNALDALGLAPLESALAAAQGGWPIVMDNWDPTKFTVSTALNSLRSLNVYPFVSAGVGLDIQNVSTNILYVDAGTVPLGVSLMENPPEAVLLPYATLMTTAAKLLRDHMASNVTDLDIESQVLEVIDFEVIFSQLVMKAVNETTNHLWRTDVTGLQTDTDAGTPGQFNWLAFMKEMFTGTGVTIQANEPIISFKGPFFRDFSNLLANTNPRVLANALGWWWAFELQMETTDAMRNASFNFFHDLYGIDKPLARWTHCMDESNANLGFALSREYVDEYVAETVKPETTELVEYLRQSFSSLMNETTWMLPQDMRVAQEKLAAIDPFVAYPDWIMNDAELTLGYEGLNLLNGDQVGNLERIGSWYNFNSLVSLREKPEHSFLMPPTIVNAFYNPEENTITILSGILQPPFYSHNSLAALNYGGIGMVIGHEMTHGFDNTGRLFDKDGNLVAWWSNETIIAYNEHALCFVEQYDGYVPPELIEAGIHISINGLRTLGENIADNGGIREAYRAYQSYVDTYGEEARLPGLDEFSPNHLFYLGFANEWCEHKDASAVLNQLYIDVHSPGRYRVLGPLSNDEEFSKVWNCPAGTPMNRGDERCLLW
ncbi:hypothetical protein Pcinc_012471 [Petrolisthes cinctipes]|uniref:Endothelin-converting enzyme 1 n=1 Tax=Petrolisthes cinctipes TaxID=88211 RepID=A0AAE1FYV4_PETCI|nr:hypothetical protein Pcinc_012471 [Petrolisthes cinctipes]